MIRIVRAAWLRQLEQLSWQARLEAVRLREQLVAADAARGRAEQDAQYWRERAELFIDQIGLRSGTIYTPTMTPQPASGPDDVVNTVFTAMGKSELPQSTARAAAPAAVTGVSPAAAEAAVDDLLRREPSVR